MKYEVQGLVLRMRLSGITEVVDRVGLFQMKQEQLRGTRLRSAAVARVYSSRMVRMSRSS